MSDLIKKLKNWRFPVVGIGVTAFTRIGPAFLLPNFSIVCLLETADLSSIRQLCPVHSLERDFSVDPESLEKQNTISIIKQKPTYQFLQSLGEGAGLLVYKSSPRVEAVCQELGIKVLSNPASVRDPFEDKKEFRILGEKAGLRLIPGETLLIDDLTEEKYGEMLKKYGSSLVFQLPDYKVGGGIGTFFIKSLTDYQEAMAFIERRREAGKKLVWLNVTRYITGMAASISACVTRHGVLCGLVQTQLVDLPEARAFKGRSGVWLGHDWGWKQFDPKIQEKAENIAKTIGSFMAKKGYRGMFGVDLVIKEDKGEVWPVECNARYTGGFPVYSMMQALYQEIPFDAFHLAEFLDIDYELDLDKLQRVYRQPKAASHVVIHNQTRKWVKIQGKLKSGVYRLKSQELVWQRSGFTLKHLKNNEEFCLVDRVALPGRILKPGERFVRVLFRDKIAVSSNQLNAWASQVCREIYKRYELEPLSPAERAEHDFT